MHSAVVHFLPVLAAEKSKVPFYIAGGALVAWALILSVGIGIRRPDFPGPGSGQNIVISISVLLVIAAASTAVITSGGKAEASSAAHASRTPEGTVPPPTPPPTAASTGAAAAGAVASTPAGGVAAQAPANSGAGAPPPASTSPAHGNKTTATTGTPAPASSPAAKPAGPLQLAADPSGQLKYDTAQLTAKAGKLTIDFANAAPEPHNVVIAQGSKIFGQTPQKTGPAKLSVTLKPGTYTFYCAVPGHRQAGMQGTLTIS